MKKIILSMAVVAMMVATSCKNETVVKTDGEEPILVEDQTTVTTEESDFETIYNNAVIRLEEAKKSGDAEAEKLAQEAVDNAKAAWETAKAKAQEISTDVKEEAAETKNEVKQAVTEVKEEAKKAAAETKKDVKEAKEEAKKEYNSAVDKIKIK